MRRLLSIFLFISFQLYPLSFASGTQALKFDNDPSTSLEDLLRDQVHLISK
jgi:hypothetical protein